MNENIALREQCMTLHENEIKNKQKIQLLISRISEYKRNDDEDPNKLKESKRSIKSTKSNKLVKDNCGICSNQ